MLQLKFIYRLIQNFISFARLKSFLKIRFNKLMKYDSHFNIGVNGRWAIMKINKLANSRHTPDHKLSRAWKWTWKFIKQTLIKVQFESAEFHDRSSFDRSFELDLCASYESIIAVYRFRDDSQWPLSAMNLFVTDEDEITLFQILLYVVPLWSNLKHR